MRWKKLGLLITPQPYPWMVSHVQNPFSEHIEGDLFRIHFAARDQQNRSRGGTAIVEISDHPKVIKIPDDPYLDLGPLGAFDDSGVMPSCIVHQDGKKYLYYTGWSRGYHVPFFFFIGLAISEDRGKTYQKYSLAPVLGRTPHTPFMTGAPWVIKENGIFRMWFSCCTRWEKLSEDAKPKHYYNIQYAESDNGIQWQTKGQVCVGLKKDEYAIGRPIVSKDHNGYNMWYSFRSSGETYRAGYAVSKDGLTWQRQDKKAGIETSQAGWDSTMICYPCPLDHKGKKYLLYNGGENYGETGAGLALLESES